MTPKRQGSSTTLQSITLHLTLELLEQERYRVSWMQDSIMEFTTTQSNHAAKVTLRQRYEYIVGASLSNAHR
jgi:hypothetical protein